MGVLAALAAAAVVADGPSLAHDLRSTLLHLTPPRALAATAVVGLVMTAWSLGSGRRGVGLRSATARVPVVLVLGAVVVAAATFRLLLVRAATEPTVLGDELIYSGLAKGFALDSLPRFRGELDLSHSLVYPLVLSPVYALASDGARAFEAVKAIDAIVVASTAIPAYLLARRVAGRGLALAVGGLVAFEPWTAYASLVMTESFFLPAFTTFVLLFASMLERPSRGRQLAVLLGLVVLVGIRPQASVLFLAVAAGIAFRSAQLQPARETLRPTASPWHARCHRDGGGTRSRRRREHARRWSRRRRALSPRSALARQVVGVEPGRLRTGPGRRRADAVSARALEHARLHGRA